MKVFLCWSGKRSHEIAKILNPWLKDVIQSLDPWISSDIDKGAPWLERLNQALNESTVGIVCVTGENKNAPWLLFEAGALARAPKTLVCTFLIDIETSDLDKPLSNFQLTVPTKEDMRKLINTLNAHQNEVDRKPPDLIERGFERCWPEFERSFKEVLSKFPSSQPSPKKSDPEILREILDGVRGLERQVDALAVASADPSPAWWGPLPASTPNVDILRKAMDVARKAEVEATVKSFLTAPIPPPPTDRTYT